MRMFCVSPSSGQCGYGGAGEGAEETSGGEVPEGPLRGDRCTLWCQGTTKHVSFDLLLGFLNRFSFLSFVPVSDMICFVPSRPHYCRANSIRSLRLQSGKRWQFEGNGFILEKGKVT